MYVCPFSRIVGYLGLHFEDTNEVCCWDVGSLYQTVACQLQTPKVRLAQWESTAAIRGKARRLQFETDYITTDRVLLLSIESDVFFNVDKASNLRII